MGILSSLFDFFADIFSSIWTFMKDNWLVILLIVVAVLLMNPAIAASIWGWLSTSGIIAWLGELTLMQWLVGAVGVWFLSDPAGAIEYVTDVITEVISTVAEGVSNALGLPKLAMIAGLGIAAYYFFVKDDGKEEQS